MAVFVLDATPLIHLPKTRLHGLVGKLGVKLFTTPIVRDEVLKNSFSDHSILARFLRQNVSLQKPKMAAGNWGLDAGEAGAIALAAQKKCSLVSDDGMARAVAKAFDIPARYTTYFIFRALEKKVIGREQAELALEELVKSGLWCDPDNFLKIMAKIREYGK